MTHGAPNGNYTVPVDECIRALSAAATGTTVDDWALTTLGDGAATTGGRTRYATRYTAALAESAAGEDDVALRYARYVGGGRLDRDMDDEPACNGTDFTVRLQTAAAAGVEPTGGAGTLIPPSTDASEATAVGSIVVAGPVGPATPPVAATVAPVAPIVPLPVPVPIVTTPPATAAPTVAATAAPREPPTATTPVPAPIVGEPLVGGAAEGEVEATAGETDDGGSNLVPILIGCALGAAALGLAAFAILTHVRTGEAPAAAAGAAVARAPPPPPPAAAVVAPPPPAVVVPVEPVGAAAGAGAGDATGLAVAGAAAAGTAAVAVVPLVAAAGANTHDYQIGQGPVAASSPPPPPGFVIPAEAAAIGGVDGTTAGTRGVEGLAAVEGATLPPTVAAPTVVEGVDAAAAAGAPSSALPGVAAVGATGAALGAAVAAPFVVAGRKDSRSSASSMGGAPEAPVMNDKERAYYQNVRYGSDAPPPPPPPPALPVLPVVGAAGATTMDNEAAAAAAYGVPPPASDFPAADVYGAGVEEPASFGGKMMSGLTGGLAAGRDTVTGAYESVTGGAGAAGATEEARDMGMPVLDSPEYSDLRADAADGYGRR
ncbi:hypothetical protein I4F81_011779 [Pyropia yezoensis]|uniref:Uncharacterized protein n=1 Tax=Pyropia yezoensis TaxID=2788 RepID=A0ACC3CHP8_PYRYE|nr:hypothetical protein I4F81_011779 [Neopyropia yezoensis]